MRGVFASRREEEALQSERVSLCLLDSSLKDITHELWADMREQGWLFEDATGTEFYVAAHGDSYRFGLKVYGPPACTLCTAAGWQRLDSVVLGYMVTLQP